MPVSKQVLSYAFYVFLKHVFVTGEGDSSFQGKGMSDVPFNVCLHWRLVSQCSGRCTDTYPFLHGTRALRGVQPSAVLSSQLQKILQE